MVLDYKIEVDGRLVKFTLIKIDTEALDKIPLQDAPKCGVLGRWSHERSTVSVYTRQVVLGTLPGNDYINCTSDRSAKKFAADVTKAIETLTGKKSTAKKIDIKDHFQYNFALDVSTKELKLQITKQSPVFTKFISENGDEHGVKTCNCPEFSGSTLFIKGSDSRKTECTQIYDSNTAAISRMESYEKKIKDAINAFVNHTKTISYPVRNKFRSGETGVFVVYNARVQNKYTVTRSCSGILTRITEKDSHEYTASFFNESVILNDAQAKLSVAKLLSEKVVPSSSDFKKCKFLS